MCGITGFLDARRQTDDETLQHTVREMAAALQHRGPDSSGVWVDETVGVALGHQRLAIVDLSPAGHQPMRSADGRFVLVYNGEIYNFKALQQELGTLGYAFQGTSDTEVLLAAISEWGLVEALRRCVGMFAFALWDRQERVLHLARDRIGEKPLYYGWMGDVFLFGSELKSLHRHPCWQGTINRDAIALLLRYNHIPTPFSIYRGIAKLEPATYLSLPLGMPGEAGRPTPVAYWHASRIAEQCQAQVFSAAPQALCEHLEHILLDAIGQQMVADVPVGAFLSGGIDSSLVVALMQHLSAQPVKTFTIGFHQSSYDEAVFARHVARHIKTDHTEFYVTPQEAREVIPRLPTLYDEPFADASQIPTFLIAQLTRQHVTVSLSGDGGDELFGGYIRYLAAPAIWQKIGRFPLFQRYATARLLTRMPTPMIDRSFGWLAPLLAPYGGQITRASLSARLYKAAETLSARSPDAVYQNLCSHWKDPLSLVIGAAEPRTVLTDDRTWPQLSSFEQRMMYLDLMSYVPDDALVKVDRASMGVGLESRLPFLDHRVIEFAWRLPLSMKLHKRQGKWLLRQLLSRYIPDELIDRPKMGFGIPIDSWLRGPLREWAETLLDEQRLREEGFFMPERVRNTWAEHLAGIRNWHYHLWSVLMFQAWLEHWKPHSL